jgi:hypothetical protein
MDGATERTGRCLCGAVRIRARVSSGVQACHCVQCQRWTGGGPYLCVHAERLEVEGEDAIRSYRASAWGERLFCGTCGSTLFWRMQGHPSRSVPVGLLDDQTGLSVTEEIFVDHRPGWLPAWPGAVQSTEAQETAKLAEFLKGDAP